MKMLTVSMTVLSLTAPLTTVAWVGMQLPSINLTGQFAAGLTDGCKATTLFSQALKCD